MIEFIKRAARIIDYTLHNLSEVCELAAQGSLITNAKELGDITITEIEHFDYQDACPWDYRNTLDRALDRLNMTLNKLDIDRYQVINLTDYFDKEKKEGQTDNEVAEAVAKAIGVDLDEE